MFRMRTLLVIMILFTVAFSAFPVSVQGQSNCPLATQGFRRDATGYGTSGRNWVGVRESTIEAPERSLSVTAWYPALNPDCTAERVTYGTNERIRENPVLQGMFPRVGRAIPDAEPNTDQGPYPLVIFSHAVDSQRWQSQWLAEHLASHGFVVLATDHEDHRSLNPLEFAHTVLSRPADITRLIDYATELSAPDGAMAGMISTEKVGVIGHDWGALAVLQVAGARYDIEPLRSWCADHPDVGCTQAPVRQLEQIADELGYPQEGLWPSVADPRVAAVVSMSAWSASFTPAGLQSVTVPTLVLEGSFDEHPEDEYGVRSIYDSVGAAEKALVVFEQASYGIFFAECTEDADTFASDFAVCSDQVWDMDRAHDITDHFVTAFLLQELKDLQNARPFLRAGGLQFTGVTLESTIR